MADTPRRVNAAQLAARKIKTTTGVRKRLGGHSSTVDLSAPPIWASPNVTSSSSGLFGGGISAAGSFSFSAPGPSVSFGPASGNEVPQFAPMPQDLVQNLDEKRKADAMPEELERRNKPFQMISMPATGAPSESSQPSSDANQAAEEAERRNKPFQMLPMAATTAQPESSLTSSNPFKSIPLPLQGNLNGTTSINSNPFQTSQSAPQSSSSSFNFGAATQPTSNFSFGQSQQAQPAINSFNFGSKVEGKTANIFSFGQNTAAQLVTTGVSGSSTPAPNNSTGSIFSFGQMLSQSSSSALNLNTTPAPAQPQNIFGQTQLPSSSGTNFSAMPAPSQPQNKFGLLSAQSSSTSINFNATPAPTKPQNKFDQAQPPLFANPSAIFNSTSTLAQPQNTFGQSQPQPSTQPTNMFGQLKQQSAPASSNFSNMQSQTPTTTSTFGTLNQQPSNSLFSLFGQQANKTAAGSGTNSSNSSSAQGDQQPNSTSVLFGNQAYKPSATSTLFGAQAQQKEPVSSPSENHNSPSISQGSIFGGLQQQQERQSTPSNSIFGAPLSTSNLFAGQQASPASSSSASRAAPIPANNIFTIGVQQSGASSNLFGKLNMAPQNTSGQALELPSSSFVTAIGAELANTNTVHEVPPSPKPAFSFLQSNSTSASKPPAFAFSQASSSNGPEDLQQSDSIPSAGEPKAHLDDATSRGPVGETMEKPKPSSIFSKWPTDVPEDASQPIGEGPFPGLPKPGSSILKNNVFALANAVKVSPSSKNPSYPSDLSNGNSTAQQSDTSGPEDYDPKMGEVSDQVIEKLCPPHFNEKQGVQFFAAYRLRALNKGFLQSCEKLPQAADFGPSCKYYMKRREEILEACRVGLEKLEQTLAGSEGIETNGRPNKRSEPHGSRDVDPETEGGQRKRPKPSDIAPLGQHLPKNSSPLKTQPVVNSDDQSELTLSSEKQVQNNSISPLKPLSLANGSTTPSGPPTSAFPFGSQSVEPMSPTPKGKRKAEVQITQDDPTGERGTGDAPRKKVAKSIAGSETSNIFRSILDGPSETPVSPVKRPGSPEKRILSPRKSTDAVSMSFHNPFSSLPSPLGPVKPSASSSSISPPKFSSMTSLFASATDSSGVRAPNDTVSSLGTTNIEVASTTPVSSEIPSSTLLPAASASGILSTKPVSAGTPVNLFTSKIGTNNPGLFSTSLFTKKPTSTQTPSGSGALSISTAGIFSTKPAFGDSTSSPFALKTGTATSSLFSSQPALGDSTSNPLKTGATTPSTQPTAPTSTNIFGAKTTSTATTSTNIFGAISASIATSSVDASTPFTKEGIIKPPTFGNTQTDFLAQFSQKSQENLEDIEKKTMEKNKLEELDSDDDEGEWETKWREKRAAEKKALENLSKSNRVTFVPGQGFTFAPVDAVTDTTPSAETAQPAPKPVFAQQPVAPPTTNIFTSVNGSAASSPGAASSTTSSVFDHLPSSKPVTFGANNIFGHLSDVDSGADSVKGNDADDDNTEDGEEDDGANDEDKSSESNEEQDSEKNDTTYDPNREEGSGPGTPGTPPEETGPGIASARKSANFLGVVSVATTPTSSGSLFDRITKDSQGNPIRQIPTDDKENAEPSTANAYSGNGTSIFAKLGTTSKSPGDNTWKPESPIKFSASTPPSVSITAPTPIKASPFAGLFNNATGPGSSSTTSTLASPFAGLFGNSNTPKPPSLFANFQNSDNKLAAVGFGFGATSTTTSSLLPSAAGSTATSRATSPGGTTDGETTSEAANDPDAEHQEQINLTAGGPGEENEEIIFEIRAKALKHGAEKDAKGSPWLTKGIGPLRILKHKETGAARILLRADPSGTVVVNKGILAQVKYEAAAKTVRVLSAADDGNGLETWVLQVKTPEIATELATVLESNKPEA